MNKELKVAIVLLIGTIGLISYFELNKEKPSSNSVSPVEQPVQPIEEELKLDDVKSEEKLTVKSEQTQTEKNMQETTEPDPEPVVEEPAPEPIKEPIVEKEDEKNKVEEEKQQLISSQNHIGHDGIPLTIAAKYKVVKGDTVSQISEKKLGSIKFLPLLMDKNPELRADQLFVGITLQLPSRTEVVNFKDRLKKPKEIPLGARTYEVSSGDTLHKISRKHYGTNKMVNEILKANPNIDPRKLGIGSILILPEKK